MLRACGRAGGALVCKRERERERVPQAGGREQEGYAFGVAGTYLVRKRHESEGSSNGGYSSSCRHDARHDHSFRSGTGCDHDNDNADFARCKSFKGEQKEKY